jgi:CubicO group peptidase (beta-lactamase class C family)
VDIKMTAQQLIVSYASGDLDFEPGSRVEHSAIAGCTVLGAIIERVTGSTYEENLQSRIMQPLGLADTGFIDGRSVIQRFATSYLGTIQERRRHLSRFPCNGAGIVDRSSCESGPRARRSFL